jgi:hypothetical protein
MRYILSGRNVFSLCSSPSCQTLSNAWLMSRKAAVQYCLFSSAFCIILVMRCREVSVAWIVAMWCTCVRNWNYFGHMFLLLRLANEFASVCESRGLTWSTLQYRTGSFTITRNWITNCLLRARHNVLLWVGVPTALRLQRSGVQIQIGARNFSSPERPDRLWVQPSIIFSVCLVLPRG